MTPQAVRFLGVVPVALALVLGGCGNNGSDSTTNPVDTVPPAVPVNLQVTADLTDAPASIDIVWDANTEPDLAGYVIERSLDRGQTWTTPSASLLLSAHYQDAYYARVDYRVAAVDLSENESAFSTPRGWVYITNPGPKNPSQVLPQY